MSAQPTPKWKDKNEEFAFYRRRDHSNIEALQNLAIAEIAQRALLKFMKENPDADPDKLPNFEMLPNVRHLVSALQGAHGGGMMPYEEVERNYLCVGAQLQFSGNEGAIRARVRNWINALDDWQFLVGFQLFVIRKGGQIVYGNDGNPLLNDDGSPVREGTKFIDYLKPHVDEGVQRARFSEQWRGDSAKNIKPHPGLALEAQVDSVIENLPTLESREESGAEKPSINKQPVHEYQDKQTRRIGDSVEKVADEIEVRGGDSDLWLEKLEIEIKRRRESRRRTKGARQVKVAPHATRNGRTSVDATTNMCNSEDVGLSAVPPPAAAETNPSPEVSGEVAGGLGYKNITQENIGVFEDFASEDAPNMLEWANFWAGKCIPVFPLHEVYDGTCTCTCADHWRKKEGRWVMKCEGDNHFCGSECGNKGKHPRTDRKIGLQNGVKIASTDPEKIKVWWEKYPTANIGGRMLGKLGIDVDPKHGGNAAIHDLCEKYGQEWLDGAWRNASGSGGDHFIFDNKTGVPFQNSASKIGPGIDTRGDEGYLVMPPSLHVSGQRYAVISPGEFPPIPQFIIDALNAPKSKSEVVFQDRPARSGIGNSSEKFLDGHRNDGLLAYGLGRMRYAWERTEDEHYSQLSRVNQLRCVPPLDDDEVRDLAAHIANDYAQFYGVNVEAKGAAA
jgi:hypothetical protein